MMTEAEFEAVLVPVCRKAAEALSGQPLVVIGSVIAHFLLQDEELRNFVLRTLARPDADQVYASLRASKKS